MDIEQAEREANPALTQFIDAITERPPLWDDAWITREQQDDWKDRIEARDRLDRAILNSRLANLLYPSMPLAKDREARLQKDFPEFHAALTERLKAHV